MSIADVETMKVEIYGAAAKALADNGFNGPNISLNLRPYGVTESEALALYGLDAVNRLSCKTPDTNDGMALLFDLARKTMYRARKGYDNERLANLQGAAISRIVHKRDVWSPEGRMIGPNEVTPLQFAMTQFLLSEAVQQYAN